MANTEGADARPSRLPYYPGLDGLRGLVVIGLLCFHGGFEWASGGYLAVSSFFVLSGYLITSLLLVEQERSGRIALGDFWYRRFRRLLPAAFMGVALATAYGFVEADAAQLARLRGDALSALAYVANWRFMLTGLNYEDLFGRPSPLQHYWSLSIEEQFYLVFPPLAAFLLGRGAGGRKLLGSLLALLALGSSALMAFLFVPETSTSRIYYGSDTRAAELFLGALFALRFTRDGATRIAGGATLQATAFISLLSVIAFWNLATIGSPWIYRGGFVLHGVLNLVVIAGLVAGGPLARVLALGPLRFVGRISYGTYLYHWPIFQWISPQMVSLDGAPLFLLQVGISIALASASYFIIEEPIRHGGALSGARGLAAAGVGAAFVVSSVLYVTHDPPQPWFLHGAINRTKPMPEVAADGSGPKRILVVGDSVMKSIGRGIERRAGDHDMSAWNIAVLGCGVARRGERVQALGTGADLSGCTAWSDWWPIQLSRFRPHYVVIGSGPWDVTTRKLPEWSEFRDLGDPIFDDWLVSEFVEAVDVLTAEGAKVVWLSTPCMAPVRETLMLAEEAFALDKTQYVNREIIPRVLEARGDRILSVDLYDHVCPNDEILQKIGGRERLRPDGVHFSVPGADYVAGWLLPKIAAIGAAGSR